MEVVHDSENDQEVLEYFGQTMRDLHKEFDEKHGISTYSINKRAADIGVSSAALQKYEKGISLPAGYQLRKISKFYDVSTDFLLGISSYPEIIHADAGGGVITWNLGFIPISETDIETVFIFKKLVSGLYTSWDALLHGEEDEHGHSLAKDEKGRQVRKEGERILNKDSVMRAIEDAISIGLIVIDPLKRDRELEDKLKKKFPHLIRRALIVVAMPQIFDNFPEFQQVLVALSASFCFEDIVQPGDDVAISGGSTLLKFARCIKYDPAFRGVTFYPLDINPLSRQVELDASSIAALLKIRLNCKGYALHHEAVSNIEVFSPKQLTHEAFEVMQRARDSRLAFVGVGSPPARGIRVGLTDFFSEAELRENKVVADLLFHLLDAWGEEVPIGENFNARIASMPLGGLKKIAENGIVVGVVHGDFKAAALRAVIEKKYISGIVTHKSLAKEVHDMQLPEKIVKK